MRTPPFFVGGVQEFGFGKLQYSDTAKFAPTLRSLSTIPSVGPTPHTSCASANMGARQRLGSVIARVIARKLPEGAQ